jgi:hypothetical protein
MVCADMHQTLAPVKHTLKLASLSTTDGAVAMRVDLGLCKIAHIYTQRDFCDSQTQSAKVLKTVPNNWGSVVLSSKARAHTGLIRKRKPNHKVDRIYKTYEAPLYRLIRPEMVLSVSVCRISMVVYIHKISWLKTLLLNNGKIYNAWVPQLQSSNFALGCLCCTLNI